MDDPIVGLVVMRFGPILNYDIDYVQREISSWVRNGLGSYSAIGRPELVAVSVGRADLAEMTLKSLASLGGGGLHV